MSVNQFNYLSEIEAEYSRIRGKYSLLTPIDWNLADSWEQQEIPLHIVLRAMSETWRNFVSQKRAGTINTLRYFEPEVKKQYAEWLSTQVGKNNEVMTESFEGNITYSDEQAEFIEFNLLSSFDLEYLKNYSRPVSELLSAAIKKVRSELIILVDEIKTKQLSVDTIEEKLSSIATEFDLSLIADCSDSERAEIIKQFKDDYGKFNLTDELLQKRLTLKLYQKYGLPQLTLFAF